MKKFNFKIDGHNELMKNLQPFKEHNELLNLWQNNKPIKGSEHYDHNMVAASEAIKNYLLNLSSSLEFNKKIIYPFNRDYIKDKQRNVHVDQAISVHEIEGHTGHIKLSDDLYTWSDVLLQKLKDATVCHLIEMSIQNNQLYSDLYIERLEFIKFNGTYYFSDYDGMHRIVLAKYILSHNFDCTNSMLYGVKVVSYL